EWLSHYQVLFYKELHVMISRSWNYRSSFRCWCSHRWILFVFPYSSWIIFYVLLIVAFIGALLTALIIYLFTYNKHTGLQPVHFVLTGVGFSMALSGVGIVLISSAERE